MIVIIAGSRGITDYDLAAHIIESSGWKIDEVCCGLAKGVDTLGEKWALANEIPIKFFPAKWKMHGRSAGVIRNIEMAEYAGGLIAIWDGHSRGTMHMIRIAKEKNLHVIVWNQRLMEFMNNYERNGK